MNWNVHIFCQRCGGPAYFFGSAALTDHYRCRDCGTEHALDFVAGKLSLAAGASDTQRFAAALKKHRDIGGTLP